MALLLVQMATLGVFAKLKLEGVAKRMKFKVSFKSNWFLDLQIIGYYLYASLIVVMTSLLTYLKH